MRAYGRRTAVVAVRRSTAAVPMRPQVCVDRHDGHHAAMCHDVPLHGGHVGEGHPPEGARRPLRTGGALRGAAQRHRHRGVGHALRLVHPVALDHHAGSGQVPSRLAAAVGHVAQEHVLLAEGKGVVGAAGSSHGCLRCCHCCKGHAGAAVALHSRLVRPHKATCGVIRHHAQV